MHPLEVGTIIDEDQPSILVGPAAAEAKAGELLEPRSQGPVWTTE
jgi:hypothetical protein